MEKVNEIQDISNESKEDNRRSEGEISDNDSSDNNRNGVKASRDGRRREKFKRNSRGVSRSEMDKKHGKRRDKKRFHRRSSFSDESRYKSHSRPRQRSRTLSRKSGSRSLSRKSRRSRSLSRKSRSRSLSRKSRPRSLSRESRSPSVSKNSRYRSVSKNPRSRSDRKYRPRNRSYDSNASDESGCNGDKWSQDKYKADNGNPKPNSVVMLKGLASCLAEVDIRRDLLKYDVRVKDIRVIRKPITAASRGFAFVEFNTVQDASKWMDEKKGLLTFEDGSQAKLVYSFPYSPLGWYCSTCLSYNYKTRDLCYKCHAPRPETTAEFSKLAIMNDDVSLHPTCTIILSGLNALTTEEKVLQAFEADVNLAYMPIKSIRIARDSITNLSLGMCYVDTNTISDAAKLYSVLLHDAIEIDSSKVGVAYCKPKHYSVSSNKSVATTAVAAAQWTNSGASTSTVILNQDDIERFAEYSASLYAKTPEEYTSYLKFYRDHYRNQSAEAGWSSKKVPAESYTGAIGETSKTGFPASHSWTDKAHIPQSSGYPDTSRFQYDESSGYYYDPVSELHYDPTTYYFYDSKKRQFLYWDYNENCFIPVENTTMDSSTSTSANGEDKKKQDKKPEKKDKMKVANKIVKEMEKWTKISQEKPYSKVSATTTNSNYNSSNGIPMYKIQRYDSDESGFSNNRPPLWLPAAETSMKMHHTSYDDENDNGNKKITKTVNISNPDNSNFADYTKMACLLCQRQFTNLDKLAMHMKLSEMHKQNLNKIVDQGSSNHSEEATGSTSMYRDRAEERRMQFGPDQEETKNSLKDLYIESTKDLKSIAYTEPPKDDVGNRMLKKMGWKEGQGLGRINQGRTDIISTEMRVPNVGLGLPAAAMMEEDAGNRYTRERKVTLTRYKELE